ncbi:hypothetical protein BJ742DRAFT_813601 [Cladochytrium replicatum]|nr:hypothetical protein BJ742DRAFT_813601 [Cladochytrium replicatum]
MDSLPSSHPSLDSAPPEFVSLPPAYSLLPADQTGAAPSLEPTATEAAPGVVLALATEPLEDLPDYTDADPQSAAAIAKLATLEAKKSFREDQSDATPSAGFWHTVTTKDTLVGISLRYGVPLDDLRRANRIFSSTDDIIARARLFIPGSNRTPPPSEEDPELRNKTLVKRFQIVSKCVDVDEAWAYMRASDFDLNAALETYWADVNWEKQNMDLVNANVSAVKATASGSSGVRYTSSPSPRLRRPLN